MLKIARREGLVPKAQKTTKAIGRCLPHCYQEIGFSSPWAAANYFNELARMRRSQKGNLRLEKDYAPPGVRRVVAVRCPSCKGSGCHECEDFGWGVEYIVGIRKKPCPRHEVP